MQLLIIKRFDCYPHPWHDDFTFNVQNSVGQFLCTTCDSDSDRIFNTIKVVTQQKKGGNKEEINKKKGKLTKFWTLVQFQPEVQINQSINQSININLLNQPKVRPRQCKNQSLRQTSAKALFFWLTLLVLLILLWSQGIFTPSFIFSSNWKRLFPKDCSFIQTCLTTSPC